MELSEAFDAVLMLTGSGWKTEPGCNQYPYATRFARSMPVLVFQHFDLQREGVEIEATEIPNVDLVHLSSDITAKAFRDIRALLKARGIRRPMLWVCESKHYQPFLDAFPRHFRVYHATEDDLVHPEAWRQGMADVDPSAVAMLGQVDFMVACSQGVAGSCVTKGGYAGPHVVVESRGDGLRQEPDLLEERRQMARANSCDARFVQMSESLVRAWQEARSDLTPLRVALLYDSTSSMHVSTIREHVDALVRHSRHGVVAIPATSAFWQGSLEDTSASLDLSVFDAVIVHFSIRVSLREHLDEGVARALEAFGGLKLLFIQDEYEGTEIARAWMDRLNFDVVYTCVPADGVEHVYPARRFPATDFLPTLTGYVPETAGLERFALPLHERRLLIAYRGRRLPAVYGRLGQEKFLIGAEMKVLAQARQLPVDIEVDDSRRIYGDAWYAFLGSARATLGTESGANVFDEDGSLKAQIERLVQATPGISFEDIEAKVLRAHEGRVRMNQISPKIFEAIRLRTALVLFEGEYSGVVQPDVHFIPLRKDFSNVDTVIARLQDDAQLQRMTERAYQDVVASGRYAYRSFVQGVDRDMEQRVVHRRRGLVMLHSLASVDMLGRITPVFSHIPQGVWSGGHPAGSPQVVAFLGHKPTEVELSAAAGIVRASYASPPLPPSAFFGVARRLWRIVPFGLRIRAIHQVRRVLALRGSSVDAGSQGMTIKLARGLWHLLPVSLRVQLARRLGH